MPRARQGWMRCGFTLVELLVVIAIIGILAGLLFPVFGPVRQRAKITRALNEVQQIDMAWKAYLLEKRDLPAAVSQMDNTTWPTISPGYMETTNIMSTNAAGIAVDPWGHYYQVTLTLSPPAGGRNVKVWSMGPNGVTDATGGDDVRSW